MAINGIDGRFPGQDPYQVGSVGTRAGQSDQGSGFSLTGDDPDGGVIYEPEEQRRREETQTGTRGEKQSASTFDRTGVRLELSGAGMEKASGTQKSEGGLFQTLGAIWEAIRNFFAGLSGAALDYWNGEDQGEKDTDSSETDLLDADASEADTETDEETALEDRTDTVLGASSETDSGHGPVSAVGTASRPADESGEEGRILQMTNDPEEIQAFLTNYHGRRLAKNSDLLTYYDRTGKRVSVDPSHRRLILQGNRGEKKL